MDISLTEEGLKFQAEVREFLEENLPTPAEIWAKRADWFTALQAKGWDFLSGRKNLVDPVGPQHSTTFGIKKLVVRPCLLYRHSVK